MTAENRELDREMAEFMGWERGDDYWPYYFGADGHYKIDYKDWTPTKKSEQAMECLDKCVDWQLEKKINGAYYRCVIIINGVSFNATADTPALAICKAIKAMEGE